MNYTPITKDVLPIVFYELSIVKTIFLGIFVSKMPWALAHVVDE